VKTVTITKMRLTLEILALSFLVPPLDVQAQYQGMTLLGRNQVSVNGNAPVFYSYTTENGKLKSLHVEDPQEVVKVIVTLKDKPLALYWKKHALQKTWLATVQATLQATHSSVKSKISTIAQELSAKTNFHYQYTVRREYYTAINGLALECNRGLMKYIQSLPEVKNVQLDGMVKADLTQSVHQIRADIVQDSLGYNGDSVLVGEIDTGIDYNNPALGGGFGPQFRVIGGYDFANNDNDPMDDLGHGTHVAGIIGANGGSDLRGVAPHVKFLAVKVLNEHGVGSMSDVIAGIEYCMDPDGNPATDDEVDIINMSLGALPTAESPADEAVDNATEAGILSVVAAGNQGMYISNDPYGGPYRTISSPGTAPSALTVGACDSTDWVAAFSSRGPDRIHFAIKPEVVAPGVDILSTVLNNRTASWSGTSMATPHVTGVAALLKQEHRDWSPEQLKCAIVNSSKQLDKAFLPYDDGNGRVDALTAATLGVSVDPSVISFGIVDLSVDVWKDTVGFKVRNLRNTSQNINLEIQAGLPAGAELNLSQTSFTLAPKQETEITAIMTLPRSAPIVRFSPYGYTGNIVCRSDSDKVQVPFAVIKTNILTVECDVPASSLILYNGSSDIEITLQAAGVNNKYTLPIDNSTFNLLAVLQKRDEVTLKDTFYVLFRKNINTAGYNDIILSHTEAVFSAFHDLSQVRDIRDNPVGGLDSCPVHLNIIMAPTPSRLLEVEFLFYTLQLGQWFFGPIDTSSSVTVIQDIFSGQGDQALLLKTLSNGVKAQSDLAFLSGPANLGDLNLKFEYNSSPTTKAFVQTNVAQYYSPTWDGWVYSDGFFLPNLQEIHFMSNRNPTAFDPMKYYSTSVGIGTFDATAAAHNVITEPTWKASTSDFIVDEDGDFVFFERKPFRPDVSEYVPIQTLPSGDTVSVEATAYFPIVQFPKFQFLYQLNGNTGLSVSQWTPDYFDDGGVICSDGIHSEISKDQSSSPALQFTAQMFTKNDLLQGVSDPDGNCSIYYDYKVKRNTDGYRLLAASSQYSLLGQYGQATIDYRFNVGYVYQTCFLPSLDFFQILADGKVTQQLHPGQSGTVRLVVFDPKQDVDSVGLCLLENDGTEIGLETTHPSAKEYLASIPQDMADGFHDVIARVHDAESNTFELVVSPAFYYGASVDSVQCDARLRLSAYTLDNLNSVRFNPGDTLKYTLTYTDYGNYTARDVSIHFPETDYFVPVGNSTIHLDSIQLYRRSNSAQIPLTLVFTGKKQSDDSRSYYTPTISWNSNGRVFSREYSILVDFSSATTGITEFGNAVPKEYSLFQNYPNPFNPTTTISFDLPSRVFVTLKVFDLLGREVATIVSEELSAGTHSVTFDARELSSGVSSHGGYASGVYFYRFQAGNYTATKKLLLLK
jgi:subtilisin family serine protease